MSKKDKIIEIIFFIFWWVVMVVGFWKDFIGVMVFAGIMFLYSAMKLELNKHREDSDDKGR